MFMFFLNLDFHIQVSNEIDDFMRFTAVHKSLCTYKLLPLRSCIWMFFTSEKMLHVNFCVCKSCFNPLAYINHVEHSLSPKSFDQIWVKFQNMISCWCHCFRFHNLKTAQKMQKISPRIWNDLFQKIE